MTVPDPLGRVLVIGARGQLGTALRNELRGAIVAPERAEFDLLAGDPDALLDTTAPTVAINCAAFHNVDQCETKTDFAFAVNALAVDRFAAACAQRGVPFVTVSTDYVFAGDADRPYVEDDVALPHTAYGISKLAGEMLVRRHGPAHVIVRTSGVFGTIGTSSKGYTLIERALAQAERGEVTRMVDDMVFSPSFAPHVARAMCATIERRAFGTHHVTNAGACSWYAFVRSAFRKAGHDDALLTPISYADLGNPTPRPMYSPLANTTFAAAGIASPPPWEDALDEFLVLRRARLAAAVS